MVRNRRRTTFHFSLSIATDIIRVKLLIIS
jgi:hypothetical protein